MSLYNLSLRIRNLKSQKAFTPCDLLGFAAIAGLCFLLLLAVAENYNLSSSQSKINDAYRIVSGYTEQGKQI